MLHGCPLELHTHANPVRCLPTWRLPSPDCSCALPPHSYTFRHRWLVDEALTHCSWSGSGARCYQARTPGGLPASAGIAQAGPSCLPTASPRPCL